MTWKTKYKGEFRDNEENNWIVEFQFDGYSGNIYSIILAGQPLILKKELNDEQVSHIATKTATINILCKQHFRFLELYSSDNLYCRVFITKNNNHIFRGYVINDYQEPYDDSPYFVSVQAIDGLSHLKEIMFDDNGTPYNGFWRINKIIMVILGKIGYATFAEYINIYEKTMKNSVNDSPFDQTLINVDLFAEMNCYDVLLKILKGFNAAIVQSENVFTIYRPVELQNEIIYGRLFTSETTKTSISIKPEVLIDRCDLKSNLKSTDGGVLTFEQSAKSIKVNFDYGNRESWIENHNLPASSYDITNKKLKFWTLTGTQANIKHISEIVAEETEGIAIKSTSDHTTGIYQLFGDYLNLNPGEYVVFEFEYAMYKPDESLIDNLCGRIGITVKGTTPPLGLFVADSENYEWGNMGTIYTEPISIENGFSGWKKFRRVVPSTYRSQLYINLYGGYVKNGEVYDVNTTFYACYRNLKMYATSFNICYRRGVRSFWQRLEATPGDNVFGVRLKNKYYQIKYKEEAENIAEKVISKTNGIEGRNIEIDTEFGDITDSGLYNVIEQFQGQLVRSQILSEVVNKFISQYYDDYLDSDVIISQGTGEEINTIYFTSSVAGQDFSGATTIVNISGDLTGTVTTVRDNVPSTPEVAKILIQGSGGSGNITCNGVTKEMIFNTDIETTIDNFINLYGQAFLDADVQLSKQKISSEEIYIVFTTYPPDEFTQQPYFINISGDLFGNYYHVQDYVEGTARIDKIVLSGSSGEAEITCNTIERLAYFSFAATSAWADRYSPSVYYELNEYLANELKTQYSKPLQKIMNLPVYIKLNEGEEYKYNKLNVNEEHTNIQNTSAWIKNNCTLTVNTEYGIIYIRQTKTADDCYIYKELSISGNLYRYLIIKYRVSSNVPTSIGMRTIFYKTSAHNYDDAYIKQIGEIISDGQWHIYVADMWNLDAGGTDWKDNTITGIRIDIEPEAGIVDFEFIGFPRRYDYRNMNCWLDLLNINEEFTPVKIVDTWEKNNCTLTLNEENGLIYARKTATADDSFIYKELLSISGNLYRYLIIKYRVSSTVPPNFGKRTIFYATNSHYYINEYYKQIDEIISDGQWHIYIADMWNLDWSGNDWKDNIITGIRIDIEPEGGVIDFEFIGFPRRFISLREEYDVRECLTNVDLLEICEFWYAYWSTRFTSDAKVVVENDTDITLLWTNNGGQDYDEISIWVSNDGKNYSPLTTANVGATSKTIVGYTSDYWFKILYKKDGNYSTKYAVARCWSFTMTCITTSAYLLSLDLLDVIEGEGMRIDWGDTTGNNYNYTSNGLPKQHNYVQAGTYIIKVINSLALTKIYLDNSAINNFNSNVFLKCGDNLNYIELGYNLTTPVINSADMQNLKLNDTLRLILTQTGTYNINSEHFKNYTLNSQLYLYFSQASTFNINSEHFKNYNIKKYYVIIDIISQNVIITISRSDFSAFTRIENFIFSAGLTTDEVDNILKGLYDALILKTNVGGKIQLGGLTNAPPSGTYQKPANRLIGPVTGKEAAYELINDSFGRTTNEWEIIAVKGEIYEK